MNFTNRIKEEIISKGIAYACCKQAALAAFVRGAGSISYNNSCLSFEISTESEAAAEFFIAIIEEQYGAEIVFTGGAKSGARRDKITFECRGAAAGHILCELGIAERNTDGIDLKMEIDRYIVENPCCAVSYVKGAFLGGGSCVVPSSGVKSSGYHMEFVFSGVLAAQNFQEILKRFDINAKITRRKDSTVVYLKSSSSISDVLALMGAYRAVLELADIVVTKSRTNDINRAVNCQTGNLIKQFDASIRQLQAIQSLESAGMLDALPAKLKEVAVCRLENNEMSLSELAELLNITKSCLNHRLRRIADISQNVKGEHNFEN